MESHVLRQPGTSQPGWWVGAPSITFVPDYGFLLGYRLRAGDGRRGYENRLAFSHDGIHFEDILSIPAHTLSTRSMERPCIRKIGDTFYLYISYVDPKNDRWRIDVINGKDPRHLQIDSLQPVLTAKDCEAESVKDPYLLEYNGQLYLYISYAEPLAEDDVTAKEAMQASGDVFTLQKVLSMTGIATGTSPTIFTWNRKVLYPRPETMDSHTARLTGILPTSSRLFAIYDSNTQNGPNYEEKMALAIFHTPFQLHPISSKENWLNELIVESIRYVDPIVVNGRLYLYYEKTNLSGTHELWVTVMG